MLQKLLASAVLVLVGFTLPVVYADDEKKDKPEAAEKPEAKTDEAAPKKDDAAPKKEEGDAPKKEEAEAPKKEDADAKAEAKPEEKPLDKDAEKEARKAAKDAEKAAKDAEKAAKKAAEDEEKAAKKAAKQQKKDAETAAAGTACAICKSDKCAGCEKCAAADKGGKCDSKDCKVCAHGAEKTADATVVYDKNAKCPNCGKKMKKCVCPPVVVDAAAKLAAVEAARHKIENERRIAAAIRRLTTSGWREAYAQLVENGRDSVPHLIEAMGTNDKPAYQLGAHTKADAGRATRQRTTAEVCCEVLTDIVKHRSNFRGDPPTVDQKAWQDWWTAHQATIVIGN